MNKIIPNAFQCPNAYVDDLMHLLTPSEMACMFFAVRHIYGWQDHPVNRPRALSVNMFQNGFSSEDGRSFNGTGLGRSAIIRALDELDRFGVLVKRRNKNGQPMISRFGQQFTIGDKPDVDGLTARASAKSSASARQMERARAVSLTDRSVELTTPVSLTDHTGQLNRPDQNHKEKPQSKTSTPRERDEVFDAIAQHFFQLPPGTKIDSETGKRIGRVVKWVKSNHSDTTGDDLTRFARSLDFSPPRDVTKFAEHFTAWHSKRSTMPRVITEPVTVIPDPAPAPPTVVASAPVSREDVRRDREAWQAAAGVL